MKHFFHVFGGLLIDNPVQFVLRVFHLPMRRVCAEQLTRLPFRLKHSADFPAGILGVKLVEDIDERGHVVLCLVRAVHTVVDGNEPHVSVGKNHLGIHADLQVVTSKAAHILDDNRSDLPVIHQIHQALPVRPVKRRSAVSVINEKGYVRESVIIGILLENRFLKIAGS